MYKFNLTSILLLCLPLTGCGILPFDTAIKENHFRIENFKRDVSYDLEYVFLMCSHQKPTDWQNPKQFLSGEHNLWVKVETMRRNVPQSTRVAIVNFEVDLKPNKNYMLNRKIVDHEAVVWIQEVDTGLIVSKLLRADLDVPLLNAEQVNRKQCKTSSV